MGHCAVHYVPVYWNENADKTYCALRRIPQVRVTGDRSKVTCKTCLRSMKAQGEKERGSDGLIRRTQPARAYRR
jgi:hypothetical protein